MIRLSKLADYGIVMLMHMARHGATHHATHELAAATHVPAAMASKILKLLARAELLVSHRGAHGGYALARSPRAITIAEVIEALDGPIAITSCVDHGPADCVIEALCPARTNWQRINDAIRDALLGISIDEMAHTIPPAFMMLADKTTDGPRVAS
jgi:FeS assembly SUF system regulator